MAEIIPLIAQELSCLPKQVQAAVELLDDGATVPFIARYRKEATEREGEKERKESNVYNFRTVLATLCLQIQIEINK